MSLDQSQSTGQYNDLSQLSGRATEFPGTPPVYGGAGDDYGQVARYGTDSHGTPPPPGDDTEPLYAPVTSYPSFETPADTAADPFDDDPVTRSVGMTGQKKSRRSPRWRRLISFLAVGLTVAAIAALGLAGAYYFGANQRGDTETQSAQVTESDQGVDADESEASDKSVVSEEEPQVQTSDGMVETGEPVADVARAVGPAVVLIQTSFGQGSGIIYDQGLLVTNAHVVDGSSQVEVVLASGYRIEGEVLGADPVRDVAVVSFETDQEYGIATLAPQNTVEVGQMAVAIGSPFGLDQTVTSGIVSALGRSIPGADSFVQMIQTDASINPGNSGGALADREGRVIGMNTSIRTDGISQSNAGVGFAIPSDTFKLIADRLISGDSLDSGWLGVSVDNYVGEPGALVAQVEPNTPAERAGLQAGDLITGFNGERVSQSADLIAKVQLALPNTEVTLQIVRQDTEIEVPVVLGAK